MSIGAALQLSLYGGDKRVFKGTRKHNAALRCELRSAILERSENAERCESLLNALLGLRRKQIALRITHFLSV